MPAELHQWIIAVLEEHTATVEVDGGATCALPRWLLPEEVREHDVLRVEHRRAGDRSTLIIAHDAAATRKGAGDAAP